MNRRGIVLATLVLSLITVTTGGAQSPLLLESHPSRYVVKEGDTLWGIAARFLRDPWRWKEVWRSNPGIENPDLIYPGDVLVVTADGIRVLRREELKTVRMQPRIRYLPLEQAISTIPPNVIQPFLTAPLVVESRELENTGHVVVGVDDEIILGKYNQFYARGMPTPVVRKYQLFHPGQVLKDPVSSELLGVEAVHLGDAVMLQPGGTSKLEIVSANQDIEPGDRLLPTGNKAPLPYYLPKAPTTSVNGWVVHLPGGLSEAGRFDIAVISLGSREQIEPGDVLEAMYHRPQYKDPVDGKLQDLPDERAGLLMVFRVFEKVSYALILESKRSIKLGDRVQSPD